MLFYLSNLVISLYRWYTDESLKMVFLRMITRHMEHASVIFRNSRLSAALEGDLAMSVSAAKTTTTSRQLSPQIDASSPKQELIPPESCRQLWADSTMEVLCMEPQMHVDLSEWTSYLATQDYHDMTDSHDKCHILLEVSPPQDPVSFLNHSMSIPVTKRVKVMDLAVPLAWKSGSPFNIVAECTADSMAQLGVGLREGRLQLDDMLELHCITTVGLHGHPINLLRTNSRIQDTLEPSNQIQNTSAGSVSLDQHKSWSNILDSLHSVLEDTSAGCREEVVSDSNESLASLPLPEGCEGDEEQGNELFTSGLTPQHDQVLRLKEFRGDVSRDCDSDTDGSSMMGDTAAGEAPSDALELLAPEMQTPVHRREQNRNKPPNVLIYCGKKDSQRQFDAIKNVFETCLNSERYTIYHLKHEQVRSSPWQENSVLLVVATDKVYDDVDKSFLDYFLSGGTVLSLVSGFDSQFVERIQINKNIGILSLNFKHWTDVTVICGRHVYKNCDPTLPDVNLIVLAKDKGTDKPVIIEANHDLSGGVALLSQVSLEKDPMEMAISPDIFAELKKNNLAKFEILQELLTQLGLDCEAGSVPSLTPCYLLTTEQSLKTNFLDAIKPRLRDNRLVSKDLNLVFCSESDVSMTSITKETLPVCTDSKSKLSLFDADTYQRNLDTKVLGRVVMYVEVAYTTMTYFDSLMFSVPQTVGLIAVASRQTAGKGRGGNAWISPVGCAMFSLHVRIPVSSPLGQRVAFLQHITSLAVVEGVRDKPGYQDIDLRLKWPNDIYFGKTMKVGGVLAKSSVMSDVIHANIGCGVNTTNADPTICLNDIITQHNISHGTTLELFTIEELIARTVTNIEKLIALFQQEGQAKVVDRYYKAWLHSDAPVHIQSENLDGQIIGLDEHGYLAVRTTDGSVISVHDDGNSFDMMQNLIVPKMRTS